MHYSIKLYILKLCMSTIPFGVRAIFTNTHIPAVLKNSTLEQSRFSEC